MVKNYFRTAFRNFRRTKVHSAINLLSLCIGITCSILIYTYVQHEISYDRFFENAEQIYRMESNNSLSGKEKRRYANINQYINPGRLPSISGIQNQTRFAPLSDIFMEANNKKIAESNFWAADSSFFTLFSFPLLQGNRNTLLSQPNSIVLTQKTARKYFGDQNGMGRELTLSFQKKSITVSVTGVISIPSNTHLQFDAVVSKNAYQGLYDFHLEQAYVAYNYLQLQKNTNTHTIEKKLNAFKKNKYFKHADFRLKPLTAIHLHSAARYELSPNSTIRNIYFLSAIAIILLIIAGINFTSLATAQALQRYKEAGVRKVLGAGKGQLISQFLIEAILLALIAISAGYIIIYYTLPFFNTLSGSEFVFADFFNLSSILLFTGAAVMIGILAGIYPAILLSAFQPVKTLKGLAPSGKKGASIWKSIVVVQFAASMAMMICTVTIYQQLRFIQNKNLGFEKDRIITIANTQGPDYKTLTSNLQKVAGVKNVSISSYIPGVSKTSGTALIQIPGHPDSLTFNWISTDYNYLDTYDIKLKEGRNFSKERATDSTNAFILNEAAVKTLGWKLSPLDKDLNAYGRKGKVIGVTQNFNFLSLYQKIPPIVFVMDKRNYFNISVKVDKNADLSGTINKIKKTYQSILPNTPFKYKFVDDQFDTLYKTDQQLGNVFALFAALAFFIACLGLFSLSSFTATKKRKEIGIRKVLGATISSILLSFYKNYAVLIAAACLIAVPLSYLFLSSWLQQFAFRIEMPVGAFLGAIVATLFIALAAVSYESVNAAIANPVDTLNKDG